MTIYESQIWKNRLLPVFFLTLMIWAVYGQVSNFEFVTFDDSQYVYENTYVRSGITLANVKWAFTNVTHMCWQPLAWISHMLDSQLYGLNAGLHHWTNLVLHLVNSILLFFLFQSMTEATIESFLIAALFAVHPLNVDTVAWVSERKNLLATCFMLLSIYGYWRYTRSGKFRPYILSIIAFIAGLLSKPSILPLPFLLFLLDYWPLRRIGILCLSSSGCFKDPSRLPGSRLIVEKVPFFVMSIGYVLIFNFSLNKMYQGVSAVSVPLGLRISNALVSYVLYLGDMIWPHDLAVYYPFPKTIPWETTALAAFILMGITAAVFALIRRHPYCIVGWLWFLGSLVPVIGIVQAGLWPARADRWMYMPMIGILILVVWSGSHLAKKLSLKKWMTASLSLTIVVALISSARLQTANWRNSVSLYERAIEVTKDNFVAYDNLGLALAMRGKFDAALDQFQKALAIAPNYWKSNQNIGAIFMIRGEFDEALQHFETALKRNPNSTRLYNNVGRIMMIKKRYKEAKASFEKTLAIEPENHKAIAYLSQIEGMTER